LRSWQRPKTYLHLFAALESEAARRADPVRRPRRGRADQVRLRGRASAVSCNHRRTAHAIPSGPVPVAIRSVTVSVLRSTTATALSPLTATYARDPSGTTRMPSGLLPSAILLISLRAAASTTTSSPPPRSET